MLTDMIVKVTDELAPLKTIQKKDRYAGWMTKEIKKKINKRNYLHDRAKKTGSEIYWRIFRRYRNRLKSEMKSLKSKYMKKFVLADSSATKWSRIKLLADIEKGSKKPM